jgi:hypothetical protein
VENSETEIVVETDFDEEFSVTETTTIYENWTKFPSSHHDQTQQ